MFAENYTNEDQFGSWLSKLIGKVKPGAKAVAKVGTEAYIATQQRKAAEAQMRAQALMPTVGFMEQIPWTTAAIVGGIGIATYVLLRRRE